MLFIGFPYLYVGCYVWISRIALKARCSLEPIFEKSLGRD